MDKQSAIALHCIDDLEKEKERFLDSREVGKEIERSEKEQIFGLSAPGSTSGFHGFRV